MPEAFIYEAIRTPRGITEDAAGNVYVVQGNSRITRIAAGTHQLSTLAAGVAAIGLHGVAFLGGWIEEIGRVAGSPTAEQVGVFASLLFPSEALWRRAVYELQRPTLAGIGGGPFSGSIVPSDCTALRS